jgi:hypothetical protein
MNKGFLERLIVIVAVVICVTFIGITVYTGVLTNENIFDVTDNNDFGSDTQVDTTSIDLSKKGEWITLFDFEDDIDKNWNVVGGSGTFSKSSFSHSGNYSMRINVPSQGNAQIQTTIGKALGFNSAKITFRCKIYVDDTENCTWLHRVIFKDETDDFYKSGFDFKEINKGEWFCYTDEIIDMEGSPSFDYQHDEIRFQFGSNVMLKSCYLFLKMVLLFYVLMIIVTVIMISIKL